jgi:predicted secreted protein
VGYSGRAGYATGKHQDRPDPLKKKTREILIKFQNKKLSNEVNKLPKKTIFQKIREAAPEAQAKSILGIKKNISGDIYLQTKDEETKK